MITTLLGLLSQASNDIKELENVRKSLRTVYSELEVINECIEASAKTIES